MTAENWEIKNEGEKEKRVRKIRIAISTILALTGVVLLGAQLIPLGNSYLKNKILQSNEAKLVSPVPGAYKRLIGDEFAYWDPGTSYFQNLILQTGAFANQQNQYYDPTTQQYKDIVIDTAYSRPMALTIPSLEINDIQIQPNVASYSEDVYNQVLKNGVAHFQGTPLPNSGGNTFIYGHSAVRAFFDKHSNNPEIIFTKLEDINIGDEVVVNKDGIDYKYIVRKKKIVEPDDFSILEQQGNKESVTLMTCSPAGIASHRLIVIAERI